MHAGTKRIALFGGFGSGNFGNDGSLEAMLDLLRRNCPDADLTCICVDPERVRTAYNICTIAIGSSRASWMYRVVDLIFLTLPHRVHNWFRAFWYVRKMDHLIIPGTGALDDFATGPFGAPYALFRWCLAAWLCRTRIAFVSVGAGPIKHPISRWFMKSALQMAHYRSYRDENSRDFVQSIGVNTMNDPVFPDLAFALPTPSEARLSEVQNAHVTVGLGVMAYYGWRNDTSLGFAIYKAYLEKLSFFVGYLLDHGYRVRLLIGETTDERAVQDLIRAVETKTPGRRTERLVADTARSLHDLMRQMAESEVIVATRFHNVVCALKLGIPTISLGYAKKNQLLLGSVGLGEFSQPIETFDVRRLIDQFKVLTASRQFRRPSIVEATRVRDEQLRKQEAILAELFSCERSGPSAGQLALP